MRRVSIGLLFSTLPFFVSDMSEGQPSTPTTTAPTIDNAAPAKFETATLALG